MLSLSSKPIQTFLDAADQVLNSNTFLLEFTIPEGVNLETAFVAFVKSEEFRRQFFYNDSAREWHNYHRSRWNSKVLEHTIGSEKIVIDDFTLEMEETNGKEYLVAMLEGNSAIGNFSSPYGVKLARNMTDYLAQEFIDELTLGEDWKMFVVAPNFMYNGYDHRQEENVIRYFGDGGGCASDTATIIRCDNQAFLLLTNGFD